MRAPSPFSTYKLPTIKGATRLDPFSGSLTGEAKNQAPFTTSTGPASKPAGPGYTQAQVDASLAANPNASKGGYEGPPLGAGPNGYGGGGGGGAKGGGQSIYDLSTDPIVQRIRALGTQNYGQAVASADAQRKQLLIDAGFSDLAKATQFGALETPHTGDQATALAAAANPFSAAAQLKLAHDQAQQQIDLGANRSNLFYSSTRGNQLGQEAHSYLGNVSAKEQELRQQLTDIVQQLLGVKSRNQQGEADALTQARQQAIQNAIASGESFVGYDKDGNPIFANTGAGGSNDAAAPPADTGQNAPAVPAAPAPVLGAPQSTSFGGSTGPYIGTLPAVAAPPVSPLLATIAASNRTKKLLGIGG